jgi:hypothetical protein
VAKFKQTVYVSSEGAMPIKKPRPDSLKPHKMPDKSVFYDKIMPALFIILAVVMALLILFAIGVLTGLVPWV